MRILKRILIVILILIAIPLIAALFVKKDYAIEKEVVINKPEQVVFDYVKLLKNQDNYSTWAAMDPDMKKSYTGTDGTVGFISAWEGKEVGAGEQEILKIAEGEQIDYKLRFKKPFKAEADAYMRTEAVSENQTRVKWGFKGTTPYPFNIMNLFMNMSETVGKDFQTGLNNLKTILEKQ